MKITRIEIEGGTGAKATVWRASGLIRIRTYGGGEQYVEPRDGKTVEAVRQLQASLDGYAGTNGDVADYLRVIETFAD